MSKSGTLSKLFIFSLGAAVGSVLTWKYLETKFEQRVQEEINSINEAFSNMPKYEGPNDSDEAAAQFTEEEKKEYDNLVNKSGYVNYSDANKNKEEDNVERPYVIAPDEFGDCDYRTFTLTYYKDEILADEADNIIDDVDDTVGLSSLDTFGQYEEDTVFVRNDSRKCDYEICMDVRTYEEVTGISPHQTED